MHTQCRLLNPFRGRCSKLVDNQNGAVGATENAVRDTAELGNLIFYHVAATHHYQVEPSIVGNASNHLDGIADLPNHIVVHADRMNYRYRPLNDSLLRVPRASAF